MRDNLGPVKQFVTQSFPLLRGYLICIAICLEPQKLSAIVRFSVLGGFVIRCYTLHKLTTSTVSFI